MKIIPRNEEAILIETDKSTFEIFSISEGGIEVHAIAGDTLKCTTNPESTYTDIWVKKEQ